MKKVQPSARLSIEENHKNKQTVIPGQGENHEDRSQQKKTGTTQQPRHSADAAHKKSPKGPITSSQQHSHPSSDEKKVPSNGASIVRKSLDGTPVKLDRGPHNHEHEMAGKNTDPDDAVQCNQGHC